MSCLTLKLNNARVATDLFSLLLGLIVITLVLKRVVV